MDVTRVSNFHYVQSGWDVVYSNQRSFARPIASSQGEGDHHISAGIAAVEFAVSEETRAKTNTCWRGFACLSVGEDGFCAVRDQVGDVLIVEKTRRTTCPHDVTFGYSHICSCPVRCELFDRCPASRSFAPPRLRRGLSLAHALAGSVYDPDQAARTSVAPGAQTR